MVLWLKAAFNKTVFNHNIFNDPKATKVKYFFSYMSPRQANVCTVKNTTQMEVEVMAL